MKKVVDIAHMVLFRYIKDNCIAVDFTLGQGKDALFLAQQVQVSHVYGFDIQTEAIRQSERLLQAYGVAGKLELILDGHEHCARYIPAYQIGIFNFGFLPQGDPQVTTKRETSIMALRQAVRRLQKEGCLVLVLYPGHVEGQRECTAIEAWSAQLSSRCYSVMKVQPFNKHASPYLLIIEKHREE